MGVFANDLSSSGSGSVEFCGLFSVVFFVFFFLHVNTELRGKPTAEGWERGRGRGGTVGGREGWGSWNKLTLIYCTVAKLRHD